jgi:hypothetical protein
MTRLLKIFLCLSLLYVSAGEVNSATFQSGTDRFGQRAKNIAMSSYDFRINVIEHDGILIDAVTFTDRNKQDPFVPYDNGGHLLFTSKNVFLDVTKGLIAMNLPAGNGRLIRLVAGAGSYIEFEPRSFTITSSAKNADTVTAVLEGIEFPILPGETTRFIETNIIPSEVNATLNPKTGGLIPVAIFGSAHLDVYQIKIDSLLLESPALKRTSKSGQPATIGHLNDDSYPDLVVAFETNKSPLNGYFSYAILEGKLSDGTIIKSISALDCKF